MCKMIPTSNNLTHLFLSKKKTTTIKLQIKKVNRGLSELLYSIYCSGKLKQSPSLIFKHKT